MDDDLRSAKVAGLAEELTGLRALTAQSRSANTRLLWLLEAIAEHPRQVPGPDQGTEGDVHQVGLVRVGE
ncbi:hypothetical protein [Saccharothrix deserti]|uniref:hypothetical protein n=1 Tax=Saccharothrix deserti TaxID=2593674 RepID=UPI00131C2272|nr:hypothetical protein [Saccharothrix deserti]